MNQHSTTPPRVAFIQACWHKDMTDQCRKGFTAEMAKKGYGASSIDFFEVPGVFEIPLQAKLLARTGAYAAIVATGFIVDGGIYRHEFVSDAVITGLMNVQLETETPVLSAVLTPQRYHEHAEHHKFFIEHMVVKGTEVAEACARTIENMAKLQQPAAGKSAAA